MSSGISGKIGPWEMTWETAPRGPEGKVRVKVKGASGEESTEIRWKRDRDGIWIELPSGVHGFDIAGSLNDEGVLAYRVGERFGDGEWSNLSLALAGTEAASAATSGVKKAIRVRAQMPGKIVRVLIQAGSQVEKDQPLLVMEAMKMENEIRAPATGKIKDLKVSEGQAVESGAELATLE